MKAGNTFTIEPMINAGGHNNERWPDNWTAVTVRYLFALSFLKFEINEMNLRDFGTLSILNFIVITADQSRVMGNHLHSSNRRCW